MLWPTVDGRDIPPGVELKNVWFFAPYNSSYLRVLDHTNSVNITNEIKQYAAYILDYNVEILLFINLHPYFFVVNSNHNTYLFI